MIANVVFKVEGHPSIGPSAWFAQSIFRQMLALVLSFKKYIGSKHVQISRTNTSSKNILRKTFFRIFNGNFGENLPETARPFSPLREYRYPLSRYQSEIVILRCPKKICAGLNQVFLTIRVLFTCIVFMARLKITLLYFEKGSLKVLNFP